MSLKPARGTFNNAEIEERAMVSGYDCVVSVRLRKDAEWIPSDMKFNDLYPGWDICISKQGFTAQRKMPQEPTQSEEAQFKKELEEVANRLLDALIYLMNARTTHSEPRPSSKSIVTGPNKISITLEPISATLSLTAYGPPPTSGDIREFWNDLQRKPYYRKAVDYYLNALASKSESEVASQLYKAMETLEIEYGGEAAAYRELGCTKSLWKRLKLNLNWGKRHVEEKFEPPSVAQRMSTDECLNTARDIIERFRSRYRKGNAE